MKELIEQIINDKKVVNDYIKKHGSLNGFHDDSIKFVKPLDLKDDDTI